MSAQIRVQERYVPTDELGAAISNYNRPIVIEAECEEFPFYFRGSACLLRHQNRFFAVTCFHNLKDIIVPFDCIFLQAKLGGGHQFNIPLARSFIPKMELRNSDDRFDIAFFESDLGLLPGRIENEFYDISHRSTCYVPVKGEPILACGFPLYKATADYQNRSIGRPATIVDGRFERWSNEPHLFYCKVLKNPAGGVSDGFSGGGAFGVRVRVGTIELCFSGIVVRGDKNHFYAIDANFIREALINAIAGP
jgi:hypothetical protein